MIELDVLVVRRYAELFDIGDPAVNGDDSSNLGVVLDDLLRISADREHRDRPIVNAEIGRS